jgi:hypothetical protein
MHPHAARRRRNCRIRSVHWELYISGCSRSCWWSNMIIQCRGGSELIILGIWRVHIKWLSYSVEQTWRCEDASHGEASLGSHCVHLHRSVHRDPAGDQKSDWSRGRSQCLWNRQVNGRNRPSCTKWWRMVQLPCCSISLGRGSIITAYGNLLELTQAS